LKTRASLAVSQTGRSFLRISTSIRLLLLSAMNVAARSMTENRDAIVQHNAPHNQRGLKVNSR